MTKQEASAAAIRIMGGSKTLGGVCIRSRSHPSSRYAAGRDFVLGRIVWIGFGATWEDAIADLCRKKGGTK